MKKYILSAGIVLLSIFSNAQNKLTAEKAGKTAVVIHEVQPKEGLYSLSRSYGVKVSEIAAANGFSKDQSLSIGQKVKIPLTSENLSQKKGKTPVYYTVSSGETFTGISNRFNKVAIKDLKNWNKIEGDAVPKDKSIIVGYFTGAASTSTAAIVTEKTTEQKNNILSTKSIAKGRAKVTGTGINIRKGPDKDQPVVGAAQQNDLVEVLKKSNKEWTLIRTNDGVEGYVASQFLEVVNNNNNVTASAKQDSKKSVDSKKVTVVGTNVNMRKGPDTDLDVVAVLQQDDVVELIKELNSEWSFIRTKDGQEGFVAARFLQAGSAAKAETAKAEPVKEKVEVKPVAKKMVKAYATNINIRKGPSTDQEIVGMAKPDEELGFIRKVNDEWSEVQNAEGTKGFVASRFLSFDDKPSVAALEAEQLAKAQAEEAAANEKALAAAQKKEEDQRAAALVAEKVTAKNDAAARMLDETGFFKDDFEKHKNPNLISEHSFTSGIFKTDRGWSDGKYYLLMDNAAPGTLVKLTNPDNNKFVYAKVLGKMKGVQYSDGFDIRISEAAAKKIQANNPEKFNVSVAY